MMVLSARGVRFIAGFEGFRAAPYNDAAGHATVGYGHLLHHGNVTAADRKQWRTITRERALELLNRDADSAAAAVRQRVKVPLTQPQFDALLSFTFNLGAGALAESTLLRKLNRRDYKGAAAELLRWDHAGGKQLPGLTSRRRAEKRLFEHGVYA